MPLAGGLAAWISGRWSDLWPRWISLGTVLLHLLLLLVTWGVFLTDIETGQGAWLMAVKYPWIPQLGISFHLAVDGLSLLLLLLASFLTVLAVLTSWTSVTRSVGFFHFNLLLILTALSACSSPSTCSSFFAFWEIPCCPLYCDHRHLGLTRTGVYTYHQVLHHHPGGSGLRDAAGPFLAA